MDWDGEVKQKLLVSQEMDMLLTPCTDTVMYGPKKSNFEGEKHALSTLYIGKQFFIYNFNMQ